MHIREFNNHLLTLLFSFVWLFPLNVMKQAINLRVSFLGFVGRLRVNN